MQTRTGIFVPPIRRVVYGALAVTAAPRTALSAGVSTPDAPCAAIVTPAGVAHGRR